MVQAIRTIPMSQIELDERIYPRAGVDRKRVSMFAENIRDGFEMEPIEVQIHPDDEGMYRILDGAHRFTAYKGIGETEIEVRIVTLDGIDPLLYAAKQAIGPVQLTDDEARATARQAYENNPRLPPVEIGRAIGRSRRTVDNYIADLRAAIQVEMDLKIFRMRRLGIPIDRIALCLNVPQQTISNHSPNLATLPNWVNTDLEKGFSVPKVAGAR